MIDTLYQAEINRNLDDQLQRPGSTTAPQGPSTFAGFWRGLGGVPAGAALGFGSFAEASEGVSRVDLSQGLLWNPGTRTYMQVSPDAASRADAAAIASGHTGNLFTTETGDVFRNVARDYMPDARTTGAAGQILANGAGFLAQAGVAMGTSGPLVGAGEVGTLAGMQEADRLREQGVDEATRAKAGLAVGVGTGASMLLPISGASALARFGKGAAGGGATYVAQTEAEKLILQHAGYDKLAAQYDPLDPVGLALSAGVPGILGAALGHTSAGKLREPNAQDVALTPTEHAHSNAVEASTVDVDIAAVQKELATQKDEGARQVLQGELDKLLEKKRAGAAGDALAADPNLEPAARVQQTARAMDSSRLTADDDLAGMELHQQALEMAADQLGRGDPVDVGDIVRGPSETAPISSQPVQPVFRGRQIDVQATEAALQPVADGDVRLYRAESPTTRFSDVFNPDGLAGHRRPDVPGARYTTDLSVADYYRDAYNGNRDAAIHYIDVPKEVAERGRIADDEFKVDVSAENTKRARASRVADLARAADLPRALRELHDTLNPAEQVSATHANPEAFYAARKQTEVGEGARDTKVTEGEAGSVVREALAAPRPTTDAAGPSDAHLDAAVAQLDPEMLVHMEGMAEPMRLADLMDSVRDQAAQEGRDSRLLEVAAQCAISVGAGG